MSGTGLFVTGTDTGIGKTLVTALIARLLDEQGVRVGVMKPVTSGSIRVGGREVSEDAELLKWAASCRANPDDVAPYLFAAPLAPSVAATMEGKQVRPERISAAFERLRARHDLVLVEGAGGLMVPLAEGFFVVDMARRLGLPILVVTRPDLGTVNHTLLTCLCARERGVEVLGIIVNRYPDDPGPAEAYAPGMLEELSGVPVIATIPVVAEDDPKERVVEAARRLDTVSRQRIVRLLSAARSRLSEIGETQNDNGGANG